MAAEHARAVAHLKQQHELTLQARAAETERQLAARDIAVDQKEKALQRAIQELEAARADHAAAMRASVEDATR
jgi:hypothetical protein